MNWPRQILTLKTILAAIAVLVIGGLLLLVGQQLIPTSMPAYILGQFGGVLIATALVTILWDLFGRRSLASEIMSKIELKSEIRDRGIVSIPATYKDVDWRTLIAKTQELHIVVAYGETWRNTQIDHLQKLVNKKHSTIRVYLPDPDNQRTIDDMLFRFGYDEQTSKTKIKSAAQAYLDLNKSTRGNSKKTKVRVLKSPGVPLMSFYKFSDTIVMTLHSHRQERKPNIPTFIVQEGDMFDFIEAEIESIERRSQEW